MTSQCVGKIENVLYEERAAIREVRKNCLSCRERDLKIGCSRFAALMICMAVSQKKTRKNGLKEGGRKIGVSQLLSNGYANTYSTFSSVV